MSDVVTGVLLIGLTVTASLYGFASGAIHGLNKGRETTANVLESCQRWPDLLGKPGTDGDPQTWRDSAERYRPGLLAIASEWCADRMSPRHRG